MARPAYSLSEKKDIEAEIRSAALRLFDRVGYRGASLRAIARELGWSATALYRYFENKDALFASIRSEGFKEMQEILQGARLGADSPIDAAAQAVRSYVRFAQEKRPLYQLMYELDQGDLADDPALRAERRKAFAQAEAIAQDVIEQTGINKEANELAHLLWVSAHGLAALQVAHQLDLGQDADALIEPVLSALFHGLLSKGGSNV